MIFTAIPREPIAKQKFTKTIEFPEYWIEKSENFSGKKEDLSSLQMGTKRSRNGERKIRVETDKLQAKEMCRENLGDWRIFWGIFEKKKDKEMAEVGV